MPDTYLSDTHLVGKKPGQITSSGAIPGLGAKGTVWIDKGQQPDGRWLYWRQGYEPAPTPTPTPPPPPPPPAEVQIALVGDEAFIATEAATFGFNAGGGLGTKGNAPAGFPCDTATGYLRAGLFVREIGTDVVIRGIATEGFAIAGFVAGKRRDWRNIVLAGRHEVPGAFGPDAAWRGATDGLSVVQRVTANGTRLLFEVTLTNTGGLPIDRLRYLRTVDFDDREAFPTDNRITARGEARSYLRGPGKGRYGFLRTTYPRAVASAFGKIVMEDPFAAGAWDKPQPVGYAITADTLVNLTFDLGMLGPGASVSLAFELGVAR